MYRGFQIEAINFQDSSFEETGKRLFNEQQNNVKTALKNFIYKTNVLDGSKIQANWFPQSDADIFISHSHRDRTMALSLAGWLWDEFGLTSFIDSLVWGYANDLLKEIDNLYCLNDDGRYYNYNKRNYSTSHVHMMLSTALSMMIDKTECIFFLNTPNSICPADEIKRTNSAWIYFEIAITKLIEKRLPSRLLVEGSKLFSERAILKKSMEIMYKLDLNHLNDLTTETLNKWEKFTYKSTEYALDKLYELSPPLEISDSLHG